ncbi:hypothetical protein AX17_006325 [Amanita inopinata Kibby_2008]|nr:hypothetical protein AX17_006325 [Amanita inopinata Kibby_2008]
MSSKRPRRIVVLISGSGTNLQALIDADIPDSEIVLVFSNRKNAYGLARAANATPPIPTAYLALQPYLKKNPDKTRADYDAEVARIVLAAKPDIVILAGWMHILGESFLELLDGRKSLDDAETQVVPIPVINLHPALPGAFDGANAIERAYDAFQRGEIDKSGTMVHRVVKDVDRGEPIVVREVPIEKGESIESFEERLHRVEHEIIVEATRRVLDERPRSSYSSLSLTSWPVPPSQRSESTVHHATPIVDLPLEMDTMPFSKLFGDDLLNDAVAAVDNAPERVLSPKRSIISDLSIKTYVLEDSVISQAVEGQNPPNDLKDRWIHETDDQLDKTSVVSYTDTLSFSAGQDHPFKVALDSCLLTSIVRNGTPESETTLLYAAQLVASISSLHATSIVHGLISPETVAIKDSKYLVLCDCERRTQGMTPCLSNTPRLRDHEHQWMYIYSAPEVILGWTQSYAVDSWGFGVVLYYMLIGFHPFGDRDGQEDRIVCAKSHSLRYLHLLDRDVRDLVSRCLERNPAHRPTMKEIQAHAYFSEIDWNRMITRYVRGMSLVSKVISLGEIVALAIVPHNEKQRRMDTSCLPLRDCVEVPSKTFADIGLAVGDFGLNLDIPDKMDCPELPVETLDTTTNEHASTPRDTAKSEWFSSAVDVVIQIPNNIPIEQPHAEISILENGKYAIKKEDELVDATQVDDKDRRMQLFWEMLDLEQHASAPSVPVKELSNALSYFTSRPRRLRRPRSSIVTGFPSAPQLALWRSSIDVSTTRLNDKYKLGRRVYPKPSKPVIPTIQEQPDKEINLAFPPGIERIGNGIGYTYTYALPAASRSKSSICSSVPRSCHGMFHGGSSKFSLGLGLGIGSGQAGLRKVKTKSTANLSFGKTRDESNLTDSPIWTLSPVSLECDGTSHGAASTIIGSSCHPKPSKTVHSEFLNSPNQESEGGDTDDSGPPTPDTIAFQNVQQGSHEDSSTKEGRDMVTSPTNHVYQPVDVSGTPTLRLVSPSTTRVNELV